MFPRLRALPHRPCSRCLTSSPPEPQLPFPILNQCLSMLALWSCGRRGSVVQAQRQIHRALCTAIPGTVVRAIAEQVQLAALMRKARIGRSGSEYHLVGGFSAPFLQNGAAEFAAVRPGIYPDTEPATAPIVCAMYATALPQTILAARRSRSQMGPAAAGIAWASPWLRGSGVPHPPAMPCAAQRGIAPVLGRRASRSPRTRAYP